MNKAEIKKLLISILKEIYPIGNFVCLARIVKTYKVSDKYVCDIQILKPDGTDDAKFPQINSVEIPVIWAGEKRGIICPPAVDSLCDVYFYNGDINYPIISNFRPQKDIPASDLDELIIQQNDDVFVKILKDGNLEISCNAYNIKISDAGNIQIEKELSISIKEDLKIECKNTDISTDSNIKIECSNASIKSDSVTIDSSDISLGNGANEPIVLGTKLLEKINTAFTLIKTHTHGSNGGGPILSSPDLSAGLQVLDNTVLSNGAKVK